MNIGVRRLGLAVIAALTIAGLLQQLIGTGSAQAQTGLRGGGGSGAGSQGASGSRDQRGQTYSGAQSQARSAAERPFEERLWEWLQSAQYRHWSPMPGQSADFLAAQSPHGEYVKVYVNRAAAGNAKAPPHGSVLVKEGFAEDRRTLTEVTVMYRTKGHDPENGDWYWAKYMPDGRIARMNDMPVAGRVGMCAQCHSGADGNDYVFANDGN